MASHANSGASDPVDFAGLMSKVAPLLLGKPNERLSRGARLRFGSHGSVEVDTAEGWFNDHEAKVRGGVLDLIRHKNGRDTAGALRWLEDHGLKERSAPPARSRGLLADAVYRAEPSTNGRVFYDYRDETGAILYRVERRGKDAVPPFLQHGPDGRGGFHSVRGCMQGVRRVPYRLPDLIAADPAEPIFLCEGEKDVDRLASAGLIATTNPGGAGKFTADLAPPLAGRRVVLLQDNDDAGSNHVRVAAGALAGVAAHAVPLLLPGLPPKGDVSDWLVGGGSAFELRKLADRAFAGADQPAASAPLVIATPYEWCDPAAIPPRRWVYGRSIQRGHLRAVVAQGAAGKTILSVAEALAMVTGRNLLGQEVPGGPKRVWLWNLEDDREELSRIIQAACKHWNITPADIAGRLFVDSALDGAILKLATSTPAAGLVINRPLVGALTDELRGRGIDYFHVDPFVSSHAANESDNMEIDAIAKEWALVAKNADAGVGVAHHVSKAGAAEATALSARGAVALVNACRSVLTINRMSEEEAKRWGIEDERRRRYFRVYDDKNNRAPPSDKSDWYTMASVSLGNDVTQYGDHSDSMGVVIPWSPPDAFEGVTVDHLRRIQQVVAAGEYKAHHSATDWVGNAVADALRLNVQDKGDRARILKLLETWEKNGVLRVEERKDQNRQWKKFMVVGKAADDTSATPAAGVASQGIAASQSSATLHPAPCRGVGVAGAAGASAQVLQNQVSQPGYVAANPALGAPRDFSRYERRAPILAPSETGDEPIPGGFDDMGVH